MSITDPLIGSQLGDYRIVELLGRGGMARVYRGYDAKLDRFAAVKVIDAQLANEDEGAYRQRFLREARAIARLNHPRIVGVYQFGDKDGLYYMAMAFIEGRDLGHILRDNAQQRLLMPYRDILRVVRDIASALDHAHAGGVIHRDIKPSNIMVTSDGHAILTDFGLALSVRDGSIGNTFGSAYYIAPEQAVSSASAVPQSDLYALGVVLYQMLVGRVPFDDQSAVTVAFKHVNETPPTLREVDPSIPPEVDTVVLRMLEKDPDKRYRSGAALVRALEKAFANSSQVDSGSVREAEMTEPLRIPSSRFYSSQHRPTELVKPRMESGRRRVALTVVILMAIAALAGALILISVRDRPAQPSPTPRAVALATDEPTVPTLADTETVEPTRSPTTPAATRTEAADTPTRRPPPTPIERATAQIVVRATPTVVHTPTNRPTIGPTDTPTARSTLTSTVTHVASATTTATRTTTPTRTPVATATDRPRAESTEESGGVAALSTEPVHVITLIYDDMMLVMLNDSAQTIDVSNLQFIQQIDEGTALTFRSNLWEESNALEPHSCFQVWSNQYLSRPIPNYCRERQGWRSVSFIRLFWISSRPDAVFEVRRGDQMLATCPISAGECEVRVRKTADEAG